MRVFKFGGASVKDAESVKNVATIIERFDDRPLIVVVSAMAKTTNALEAVVQSWQKGDALQAIQQFENVVNFHKKICADLFGKTPQFLDDFFIAQINEIEAMMKQPMPAYGAAYDAVVHRGEIISTRIIAAYLNHCQISTQWLDARQLVATNNAHRRATVNWEETDVKIRRAIDGLDVYVVQGFIGSAPGGQPTTLGREGSDYTAAVFAHILKADEVTIWKDVPGVLNGDPKVFQNTVLLEEISYREAIELAYYGASVIHPKTIQPLQARSIPLYVRSFLNPDLPGTVIGRGLLLKPMVPCYIRKTDQALISISTRDLAFIVEAHLELIYSIFNQIGITVNTNQNSAISSSFCVNNDPVLLPRAIEELNKHFDVKYNTGLHLFTIRHHNREVRQALLNGREPLLEQITRETWQVVVGD